MFNDKLFLFSADRSLLFYWTVLGLFHCHQESHFIIWLQIYFQSHNNILWQKRSLHCNPLQGNYRVELLHREIPVVIAVNEFTLRSLWQGYFAIKYGYNLLFFDSKRAVQRQRWFIDSSNWCKDQAQVETNIY